MQSRHYTKLCGKSDGFTTNLSDRDSSKTTTTIVAAGTQLNDFGKRKSPTQGLGTNRQTQPTKFENSPSTKGFMFIAHIPLSGLKKA